MRRRHPNMWSRFPGPRLLGFMRPFRRPNRLKSLCVIAMALPTFSSDARASLTSDCWPDSRGERRQPRGAVHGTRLLGHCPPPALDVAASFGERLSALIVSAYLNQCRRSRFVDARQFLTTDEQFTHANVVFPKTNRAARAYFSSLWRQ